MKSSEYNNKIKVKTKKATKQQQQNKQVVNLTKNCHKLLINT